MTHISLPPAGRRTTSWGELHLTRPHRTQAAHWTNNGSLRETRALKHRVEGESRTVPIPPQLVAILRDHLAEFPDGRRPALLRRPLRVTAVDDLHASLARGPQSRPHATEQTSPLARRPYDLRHACVSTWLNAGVAAPQVADWAGHGVDVLLRIYAKTIEGQEAIAKRRIEAALDEGMRDR